eukprot:Awhi_evm1s9363
MTELAAHLGIKLNLTGVYRPSSLSINERTHRTITDMMSRFSVSFNGMEKWASWWYQLQGAYNQSVHSVTGLSPFYLVYGFQPNNPIDVSLIPSSITFNVNDVMDQEINIASRLDSILALQVSRKLAEKERKASIYELKELDGSAR